eukprot:Opistho-2@15475
MGASSMSGLEPKWISPMHLSGVNVTNARAEQGGAVYLGSDSSLTATACVFTDASAKTHGGCVFVGDNSTLGMSDVLLRGCDAGLAQDKYGAGGALYLSAHASLSPTFFDRIRVEGARAMLGPGVYALGTDAALVANTALDGRGLVVNNARAWQNGSLDATGGSVSGPAVRFLVSPLSITVSTDSPFFMNFTAVDSRGTAVSSPPSASLAIALGLESYDSVAGVWKTVGGGLSGDVERTFARTPMVQFESLRAMVVSGSYRVRVHSANLLYSTTSPLFDVTVPIAVTDCETGLVASQYNGTSNTQLARCVPVTVDGASETATTKSDNLPVALGVGIPIAFVVLVGCFAIVRWQLAIARKKQSAEVQRKFIESHVLKNTALDKLEIARDCIELMGNLGEGEFGVVFQARLVMPSSRPRMCAAKSVKEGAPMEERVAFIEEALVMQGLSHANVVSLCGIVTKDEPMLLLLEFVPYGDLRSFVREIPPQSQGSDVTAGMLASFALQIACGMEYLASMRIVHRDLAARNVMVGQDAFGEYILKVADFGLSKNLRESDYYRKTKTGKVPVKWLALESLTKKSLFGKIRRMVVWYPLVGDVHVWRDTVSGSAQRRDCQSSHDRTSPWTSPQLRPTHICAHVVVLESQLGRTTVVFRHCALHTE